MEIIMADTWIPCVYILFYYISYKLYNSFYTKFHDFVVPMKIGGIK